MALNVERFKGDIDKLLSEGHDLQLAMIVSAHGAKKAAEALKNEGISETEIEKATKLAKRFGMEYQEWYSESLVLIKQILPDRLADFKSLYERPANRKEISFVSYVISDFIIGLQSTRGGDVVADQKSAIPKFQNQLAIVGAARARFKSSLFEIHQLVQSDLFDTEIDSARELHKKNFLRAAGAIAGVVLEKHLQQVCVDHNIKLSKKNPTIGDLNEALKSNSVVEIPQWRHLSFLGDLRNLCDHHKGKEPTEEQVNDLINGTEKVIKTIH